MSSVHEATAQTANRQFVVFHVADEEYALPIEQIQEVIRYTQPRSVASNDPWTIGVISLRGKIVPVGDLAGRLNISASHSDDAKIVIVDVGAHTFGMIVDSVDEVVSIGDDHRDTSTVTSQDIISGIAKIDQRLVVMLDAHALGAAHPVAA